MEYPASVMVYRCWCLQHHLQSTNFKQHFVKAISIVI